MAQVLLVVGNSGAMDSDDTELQTILQGRGHTVSVVSDETAEDVSGKDLVVIASSVDEGVIGSKYSTISQPTWFCDMFVAVDKLMCTGTPISEAPVVRVISGQNGHAALGGLNSSSNPITVATSGNVRELNGTLASGAVLLADGNDSGFEAYFYVPAGAALTTGNSPNLRICFEPIGSSTLANFNASGDSLIGGLLGYLEAALGPTNATGSPSGAASASAVGSMVSDARPGPPYSLMRVTG